MVEKSEAEEEEEEEDDDDDWVGSSREAGCRGDRSSSSGIAGCAPQGSRGAGSRRAIPSSSGVADWEPLVGYR